MTGLLHSSSVMSISSILSPTRGSGDVVVILKTMYMYSMSSSNYVSQSEIL